MRAAPGGRFNEGYFIAFQAGVPVRLRSPARLDITVEQYCRLMPNEGSSGFLSVVGYVYAFHDDDGREVLAYHRHPAVESAAYPHLHLGHGAVRAQILEQAGLTPAHNALRPDLAGAHLPTAEVTLTQVLRMAIEQFGVEPRRNDWASILR